MKLRNTLFGLVALVGAMMYVNANAASVTVSTPEELGKALVAGQGTLEVVVEAGNYGSLSLSSNASVNGVNYGDISDISNLSIVGADKDNMPVFSDLTSRKDNTTLKSLFVLASKNGYKSAIEIYGTNNTVDGNFVAYFLDDNSWSVTDWQNKIGNGILVRGPKTTVKNNYFRNTNFAIEIYKEGVGSVVEYNTVNRFSGDGVRVLSDDTIIRHNFIKNAVVINSNHDDCVQSWSLGGSNGRTPGEGTVTNVEITDNVCIQFDDINNSLYGRYMQGIGLFDGFFKDFKIENNLILSSTWHGISVLGGINTSIKNNTLVDIDLNDPGTPWAGIFNHKNGTASVNTVIKNNIWTSHEEKNSGDVVRENNYKVDATKLSNYFVDPANYDYTLRSDISYQNAGIQSVSAGSYMYKFGGSEYIPNTGKKNPTSTSTSTSSSSSSSSTDTSTSTSSSSASSSSSNSSSSSSSSSSDTSTNSNSTSTSITSSSSTSTNTSTSSNKADYKAYNNGTLLVVMQNVTRELALQNCKVLNSNTSQGVLRCTWGSETILSEDHGDNSQVVTSSKTTEAEAVDAAMAKRRFFRTSYTPETVLESSDYDLDYITIKSSTFASKMHLNISSNDRRSQYVLKLLYMAFSKTNYEVRKKSSTNFVVIIPSVSLGGVTSNTEYIYMKK